MWLAILVTGCALPRYVNSVRSVESVKASESWDGQPLPAYGQGLQKSRFVEVVDIWHFGRNDGDVPAEIIVV